MDVLVVYQCEHCYGTLEEDGTLTWCCDAMHEEVLEQMERRENDEEEEDQ